MSNELENYKESKFDAKPASPELQKLLDDSKVMPFNEQRRPFDITTGGIGPRLVIDFSVPLDASRAKARPEFTTLTPNSNKGGFEGAYEAVKDTVLGVIGTRDTLHDHARLLARSGMTPTERTQLAREEQELKAYNDRQKFDTYWQLKMTGEQYRYGSGSGSGYGSGANGGREMAPKTPMLDELNRRTLALENNIAESAKKGMTPLQIAQLESGTASSALRTQYENGLIATIADYENKGAVPTEVYKTVVAEAREQKLREDKERAGNVKSYENSGLGKQWPPVLTLEDTDPRFNGTAHLPKRSREFDLKYLSESNGTNLKSRPTAGK